MSIRSHIHGGCSHAMSAELNGCDSDHCLVLYRKCLPTITLNYSNLKRKKINQRHFINLAEATQLVTGWTRIWAQLPDSRPFALPREPVVCSGRKRCVSVPCGSLSALHPHLLPLCWVLSVLITFSLSSAGFCFQLGRLILVVSISAHQVVYAVWCRDLHFRDEETTADLGTPGNLYSHLGYSRGDIAGTFLNFSFMLQTSIKEKKISGCLRKDYNLTGRQNQTPGTTAGSLKLFNPVWKWMWIQRAVGRGREGHRGCLIKYKLGLECGAEFKKKGIRHGAHGRGKRNHREKTQKYKWDRPS